MFVVSVIAGSSPVLPLNDEENAIEKPKKADAPIASPSLADSAQWQPVVINMWEYPQYFTHLQGLDYTNLRIVFRDEVAWSPMPFQIDEIGKVYVHGSGSTWDRADMPIPFGDSRVIVGDNLPKPYNAGSPAWNAGMGATCGSQDTMNDYHWVWNASSSSYYQQDIPGGYIDNNDEVSFYTPAQVSGAWNGGYRASASDWWEGESGQDWPYRLELEITDPANSGKAWVYIYWNNVSSFSDARDQPWYSRYVKWTWQTMTVSSPRYNFTYNSNNPDLAAGFSITEGSTTKQNIINSARKTSALMRATAFLIVTYTGRIWQEGTWTTGGGYTYQNQGTFSTKQCVIDDPSNMYNTAAAPNGEGATYGAGTQLTGSPNIEGQGDRQALVNGPIRVIIHRFDWEALRNLPAGIADVVMPLTMYDYFYYDFYEEKIPDLTLNIADLGVSGLQGTLSYLYYDIFEFAAAVRANFRAYFGASPGNPQLGSGLFYGTQGFVEGNPSGTPAAITGRNAATWNSIGDPTYNHNAHNIPAQQPQANTQLPDWVILNSHAGLGANHGSVWKSFPRTSITANFNVNGIRNSAFYWKNSGTSGGHCEFGLWASSTRLDLSTSGLVLQGNWHRTILKDMGDVSGNVYNLGNAWHQQLQNSRQHYDNRSMNIHGYTTMTFQEKPLPQGPQFTAPLPADVVYPLNEPSAIITWYIDQPSGSYTVYRNSVSVATGSWSGSQITYNIPGSETTSYGAFNYTARITDGVNYAQDQVNIYINDLPQINEPADIQYPQGATGNVIPWTVTDAFNTGTSFTVTRNGVPWGSGGSWTSGDPINVNIDGCTAAGSPYTFVITALDGYLGSVQDTVVVTVVANTAPTITSPADQIVQQGASGQQITWTVTDSTVGPTRSYSVTRNGGAYASGTWDSSVAINVPITTAAASSDVYVITALDGAGGSVQDTVNVIVNDAPALNSPSDINYDLGATGNNIIWTVTDTYFGAPATRTYAVTRGGSPVASGTWTSGSPFSINVDGLGPGSYSYNCSIADGYGGTDWDEVIVTVAANAPPGINSPADATYQSGATGNTLAWTVTDTSIGTTSYVVYRNTTTTYQTGSWSSGSPISISLNGLAVGYHNFTIVANDGLGGSVSDEVWIRINDRPVLTTPSDFSYAESTTGHTISWTVTDTIFGDAGSRTYSITNNTVLTDSGTWSNGVPIVLDVDHLAIGEYTYVITVNDGLGGTRSDTVVVTVTAASGPVITSPPDVTYLQGTTGHQIQWTINDGSVTVPTYWIRVDGAHVQSGSWTTAETITLNLDALGLALGPHTVLLEATDGGLNSTDTVIVTVNDLPTVNSPPNVNYNFGSTGNIIPWVITDTVSGTTHYAVTRDGTPVGTGAWTTGNSLDISVDGLGAGTYIYEITADDGYGGSITPDQVTVTVTGNDAPQLNEPNDITYYQGSTGNVIPWVVTDAISGTRTWSVTRNGVPFDSGTWTSNTPINVNIDGLNAGLFTFVITVNDGYGGTDTDTVLVEVLSNDVPVIESAPDREIAFIQGTTGNTLSWTVSDTTYGSPTYTVTQDGNPFASGTWTPGAPIIINIDALDAGQTNNVTITFNDGFNAIVIDSVNVTVNDLPTITSPLDVSYDYQATGNTITWTPTDNINATTSYAVEIDGELYETGSWKSGVPIIVNVDGLEPGTFIFIIVIEDGFGGSNSDEVLVIVIDVAKPIFISGSGNRDAFEGSAAGTLEWLFWDHNPATYEIREIPNPLPISTGTWQNNVPISFSYTGLNQGIHQYSITTYDERGNSESYMVTINVLPMINDAPEIRGVAAISIVFGTTGVFVFWVVIDYIYATTNYIIKQNDVKIAEGKWSSEVPLQISLDGLNVGEYSFKLEISDGLGGNAQALAAVIVTAAPAPKEQTESSEEEQQAIILIAGTVLGAAVAIGVLGFLIRGRRMKYFLRPDVVAHMTAADGWMDDEFDTDWIEEVF
jgi:hypothetical protein